MFTINEKTMRKRSTSWNPGREDVHRLKDIWEVCGGSSFGVVFLNGTMSRRRRWKTGGSLVGNDGLPRYRHNEE
jgi:hypothetical protein